jgi:hypothetical protein
MAKKEQKYVALPRGARMSTGKGWRLVSPTQHAFKAVLVKRFNIGTENVAIFRVLPVPER